MREIDGAGVLRGRALIMPGRLSRAEALRRTGGEVLPLVVGAALFLFLAASVEAFWSARIIESSVKYAAAAGLWLAVLLFFCYGGRSGAH